MRKKTIALVVVNLLLFSVVFHYLQRDQRRGVQKQNDRELFVTTFKNVQEISILGGSNDNVVLKHKSGKWFLERPLPWPADEHAVYSILNRLRWIKADPLFRMEEIVAEGTSLQQYGLANPALILRATGPQGSLELRFGRETPNQEYLYALEPESNQVFAVDKHLVFDLKQPVEKLMAKRIFAHLGAKEIRSLTILVNQDNSISKTTISRTNEEDDTWGFVTPIETSANSRLVKGLINQLLPGQVRRFVMDVQQSKSIAEKLDKPHISITLQGDYKSAILEASELIEEGVDKGLRYARLAGTSTVFATSNALFEQLTDAQLSLREKRFVHFAKETIDSIEITKGSRKILLHLLEQDQWRVFERIAGTEIVQYEADPKIIGNLLTTLGETEAVTFVSDAPVEKDLNSTGLLPAKMTVKLSQKSGDVSILLLGNTREDGLLYAKSQRERFVYAISDSLLETVVLNSLYYRKRSLAPLPLGATIQKIAVRDLEKNAILTELPEPEMLAKLPLEDEIAIRTAQLTEFIREFQVKEYLDGDFHRDGFQFEDSRVPWRFELIAEIALPGGDGNVTESRSYMFTERTGGTTQLGGTATPNTLFKLDQRMIDVLQDIAENTNPP